MTSEPFIVMIPARYGAGRCPGKALAEIQGRPMISGVIASALRSLATRVIVVTDHNDISSAAKKTGAEVLTFTGDYNSGTDRLAAACNMLGIDDTQLVVSLPCDMPMVDPVLLDLLAQDYIQSGCVVGTLGELVERDNLHTLSDPTQVKVVTDVCDRAIYFSRASIPFDRNQASIKNPLLNELYLRHIGIYAYRTHAIKHLSAFGVSPLEEMEDIEALRPLTQGLSVSVLTVRNTGCYSLGTAGAIERHNQLASGAS